MVLGGGDDDESPMNKVIAYLSFLSPGNFMVCTKDDLNNLRPINLTQAQKNHIMNLHQFWAARPVETRQWDMVTEEIYEAWLASPITPPSHTTAAPIDYDCFATAIAHSMLVPPNATVIATAVAS